MKMLMKFSCLLILASLASCGGGTGGNTGTTTGTTTGSTSTYGTYSSPVIFTSGFINALNSVDGTHFTTEVRDTWHTLRSKRPLEDDWFVIYDDKFDVYKAISLQYIRAIQYYDYYSNDKGVASEFRAIERKGGSNGDSYGDDYEVVDKLSSGDYLGRESGYLYEDEVKSTDVSLLAKEADQKKFFTKAANVSFVYNLSIEASMSMITLGAKMEKMLSRGNGELTPEDQAALASDVTKLTGVTFAELENASQDSSAKEEVLTKVAAKIGTSTQTLESKILPEVFGIRL